MSNCVISLILIKIPVVTLAAGIFFHKLLSFRHAGICKMILDIHENKHMKLLSD